MNLPPMPVRQFVNRRKPRRLGWLSCGLLVAAVVLLCTCASKAPPRAVPVPRPAESKAVAPGAEKVKRQIGAMGHTLNDLKGGLQTAVTEADRLRKQKSASEAELTRMWALLTEEQARAAALWDQLAESQITVDELNRDALARDIEIDALRQTVDVLNAQLKEARAWQREAGPKVAVYDWCTAHFRWLLVGILISGGLWLSVKYILPPVLAVSARLIKPF